MKKFDVMSDMGGVAVDCGGGNIVVYENARGDGMTAVYVFDTFAEFEAYDKAHEKYYCKFSEMKFCASAKFCNAEILLFDCAGLDGDINPTERSGHFLNGRYFIENWSGKVYFIKI